MKNVIAKKRVFVLMTIIGIFVNVQANKKMDEALLRVRGTGDFALHSISSQIMGSAYLDNDTFPDIFMIGDKWYPSFFRYKYIQHDEDGIPVFEQVESVKVPFKEAKTMPMTLTQKGKEIFLFWCSNKELNYAVYNTKKGEFEPKGTVDLPEMKYTPSAISVSLTDNGEVEVIYSTKQKAGSPPPGNKRAADFQPFDGAGIWRGTFSYDGIYSFSYTRLLEGKASDPVLLSCTESEILLGPQALCRVHYSNQDSGIISGSQMGGIYFFKWNNNGKFEEKCHIVGADFNALRHPTIWATPIIYPNLKGEYVDILATGEGGASFYKYTGNFSPEGKPIYDPPVPLKEKNPILYGGSLITPTLVDWDRDGILDIVCGNSAGYVLFFKNIGSNIKPDFISGVPIGAGEDVIHIQPDYGEDIQGPGESRWGYVGSNVFDWNADGNLDIIMNDSRSRHTVFIGISGMQLSSGKPVYLDDLALRGTWRCRPGIGTLDGQYVYITLDNDDEIHLYCKVDDYNIKEGRKLCLTDGKTISVNHIKAGGSGRLRFEIVDWDGDGIKDLILGTNKHHTIPNPITGIPWTNSVEEKGSTILFLRNAGTEKNPVFEYPKQVKYKGEFIKLGQHACSGTTGYLGEIRDNLPNLIVGDERGRLYFLDRKFLSWD